MAPAAKGAKPETHLNDWVKSFNRVASDPDWQAAWEGMLLEARAFIEQGRDIPEDEARQTGEAAGNKFWTFAKQPKGTLGDETHFRRLDMAQRALRFVANSRRPAGADPKSAQNQITAKLKKTLDWIGESFELAARGASDISFGKADKSVVKVLMTGFDPFAPSGDQSMPAKGTWNPSGAAVLAMDNTEVPAKSSAGTAGTARVQGIILPVSFDRFNAGGKGLLETIVSSKAADIDAAITVSMESNVSAAKPVRLERYVVGTEGVLESGPKGMSIKLQPVPAAGGAGAGDAILESNAPLSQIAGETEQKAKDAEKDVQKPDIGREIRFRFATDAEAKTALATLGGRHGTSREVIVSDEKIIHEITNTMVRQANGINIQFKVAGKDFTAAVVEGPGGNFLSNEVSYRMLRLLKQKNLPQDPLSFHVHTQNPEFHENDDPSKRSPADSLSAAGFMNRLVATLKRIVAATAKAILDRRGPKKP
jgi:pyrrolidone-carboxylate peptidase